MPAEKQPSSATPVEVAEAAITDEDRALDRLLAQRALEEQAPSGVDLAPGPILRETVEHNERLASHVENYQPAHTMAALEEQVTMARALGADTVEATDMVFKAIFGYLPKEPYAMYKNVKMYKIGQVDAGQKLDARTDDQVLFAKSTVTIASVPGHGAKP